MIYLSNLYPLIGPAQRLSDELSPTEEFGVLMQSLGGRGASWRRQSCRRWIACTAQTFLGVSFHNTNQVC